MEEARNEEEKEEGEEGSGHEEEEEEDMEVDSDKEGAREVSRNQGSYRPHLDDDVAEDKDEIMDDLTAEEAQMLQQENERLYEDLISVQVGTTFKCVQISVPCYVPPP